jgi:hypothetical protein
MQYSTQVTTVTLPVKYVQARPHHVFFNYSLLTHRPVATFVNCGGKINHYRQWLTGQPVQGLLAQRFLFRRAGSLFKQKLYPPIITACKIVGAVSRHRSQSMHWLPPSCKICRARFLGTNVCISAI